MLVVYDAESDKDGILLPDVTLPNGRTEPYTYARFKIGDGVSNVNDLPFVGNNEDIVGKKVGNNAEIFNDYENNQALNAYSTAHGYKNLAGIKGFKITSIDPINHSYTLEGFNGGEYIEGDQWCVVEGGVILYAEEYKPWGKTAVPEVRTISAIDSNVVFVNNFVNVELSTEYDCHLVVLAKPDIGNVEVGITAYAEGYDNKAFLKYSHAEGSTNRALGAFSHVEGKENLTANNAAHAEGRRTIAAGNSAHSEGQTTVALGHRSHSEGYNTQALGDNSHSEGYSSKAVGEASHAEGYGTEVNYTATAGHAEGEYTKVYGISSHAEGRNTVAGNESDTTKGNSTHAEGYNTVANQDYAHAEGSNTEASGVASHAGGIGTKATIEAQTAIGKYNAVNDDALFIIGNGTSDNNRSNSFEVLKDGRITIPSEPRNDIDGVNKGYLDNNYYTKSKAANAIVDNVNKSGTIIIQPNEQNVDITLSNTGKSIAVCDSAENKIDGNAILERVGFIYSSNTGYYVGSSSKLTGQKIIENCKSSKQYLVTIEGYGSVRIYTYYTDGTRNVSTIYFQKESNDSNIYFGITAEGKDVDYLCIWHESGNKECGLKNLKVFECDSAKIYSDSDNDGIISNVELYSPTTQILINDLNTSVNFDYVVDTKGYVDNAVNTLDNILKDILTAIQSDKSDAETIDSIEQTIVSYLETKTVAEVEE